MKSSFRNRRLSVLTLALAVLALCGVASWANPDRGKPYQVPMLSPEESLKTFRLPEGYRLELVASEPMIEEPVAMAWDGDGRLYVVEMRTYMQDIDGKDQFRPVSRVVRLEDRDGDGRMDHHTVFIDKLVLPRMVLPLDDRVVIRETNTFDLWVYRDTDGDGVADEKKLWHEGGPRGGNLEHQPSGLIWNIDNWLYTTYSAHRYRFTHGRVVREPLPHGSGQWGLGRDDVGKIYYSTAGGENPAMDFQQPIVYGRIRLSGELSRGFKEVFPLVEIPDVQGGRGRVRGNDTLNHFTGCGGQGVFRGDRLPADLRGDLIIPEAVGRLIRRAKVENHDGKTVLRNAYDRKEFIASTDPNFRPLGAVTGPDGCLYIVDMYRGIIQEGNWVRPGSYLRGVVAAYGLDKNIGRGRIYRLRHEDFERGPAPKMLSQSNEQLLEHLSHPNGWWRDTAQKLLVVRDDASVAPRLREVASGAEVPLGRLHALWTLEGLDSIDEATLATAYKDEDPRVRAGAVRISERFLPESADSIVPRLANLVEDPDPNVVIQVVLSCQASGVTAGEKLANRIRERHSSNEVVQAIFRSQEERRARIAAERKRAEELRKANLRLARSYERGKVIYKTLCVTCHGDDGKGQPSPDKPGHTLAPKLVGSPRVLGAEDRLIRILLHGLSGPVDDKTYTELMVPMGSNDNEWISAVINYTRSSWGNRGSHVSEEAVAAIRKVEASRRTPWTLAELHRFDPKLAGRQAWKLSASHNDGSARAAVTGGLASRWDTGKPMVPGMWFAIEFPEAEKIYSAILDTTGSPLDWPVAYEVRVSDDGESWSEPIAKGEGSGVVTRILFDPVKTKHLKVTQTGSRPGKFWSIHDLEILEAPKSVEGPVVVKVEELPPLAELLVRSGDAARGLAAFEKRCTTCHIVRGKGTAFGPDLSDVGARLKKDAIYKSIFEPSAEIDDKFRGVLVQTRTGAFVNGYVAAQDKDSLTIRQPDGKDRRVLKADVLFQQKQETSFMPEDLEKAMKVEELIDLVEFLTSLKSAVNTGS